MQLPGLLRSFGTMFTHPVSRGRYNVDPVPSWLFEARPDMSPCGEESRPHTGFVLSGPRIAPSVLKRSGQLAFPVAEIPALAIDVGNQTHVSVTGSDTDICEVRFCAQAGGPTDDDARRSLENITFAHVGESLKVCTPGYSREHPVGAWLQADVNRHLSVTMSGSYSSMELYGIDAPVRVSTTHARLKMIGVSGQVEAHVTAGVIDFAGDRGSVHLKADGETGEINLKFGAARFDGTFNAEADVAIRVVLPPAFESPFEVVVDRADLFVCRAHIAPNVRRLDRDGHAVFHCGVGDPILRFVSHGVVVMDSIAPATH